jgi:hypothetical protein
MENRRFLLKFFPYFNYVFLVRDGFSGTDDPSPAALPKRVLPRRQNCGTSRYVRPSKQLTQPSSHSLSHTSPTKPRHLEHCLLLRVERVIIPGGNLPTTCRDRYRDRYPLLRSGRQLAKRDGNIKGWALWAFKDIHRSLSGRSETVRRNRMRRS